MIQVIERLLDDLAKDLTNLAHFQDQRGRSELQQKLLVLENVMSMYENKGLMSNSDFVAPLSSDFPVSETDSDENIAGVLEKLHSAEEARLARLEHEMMAKLVNKLSSKESLIFAQNSAEEMQSDLIAQRDEVSQQMELRMMASQRVSRLIAAMQESLSHDPFR